MSTIQRQYSLPNCVLLLEGLNDLEVTGADATRQSLAILTRCECHFANQPQALVGGRDLLEGLVKATHDCAQAWMSGVTPKAFQNPKGDPVVQLQPQAKGRFRLQVPTQLLHQSGGTDASPAAADAQTDTDNWVRLDLSTVQLFDLMEAVDQVLMDAQTLPDLELKVQPLARRASRAGNAAIAKVASFALGTGSLVVAAAALFWLPVPEVRQPPEDAPLPPTELSPVEDLLEPESAPEPEDGD